MIELFGVILFCLWIYYLLRKGASDAAKKHNEKYKDREDFRFASEEEAKGCAHWAFLAIVTVIVLIAVTIVAQQ